MESSSDWHVYVGHAYKRISEEELFNSAGLRNFVLIVDESAEDFYKGLCFIYGGAPKGFFVIPNGCAIRFEPTKEQRAFAYQYNPVDLQLSYTPYRAHA